MSDTDASPRNPGNVDVTIDDAFVLTSHGKDAGDGFCITLFAHCAETGHPLHIDIPGVEPLFFVPRTTETRLTAPCSRRVSHPLCSLQDVPLDCCYFRTFSSFRRCRDQLRSQGITTFESDVDPVQRHLMERFIRGGFSVRGTIVSRSPLLRIRASSIRSSTVTPALRVLCFTPEWSPRERLCRIACDVNGTRCLFSTNAETDPATCGCKDEASLLRKFLATIDKTDPDILLGWQDTHASLITIARRCRALGIPFEPGRDRLSGYRDEIRQQMRHNRLCLPGRIILDGAHLIHFYYAPFSHYDLEFVAQHVLGSAHPRSDNGKKESFTADTGARDSATSTPLYKTIRCRQIIETSDVLRTAIEKTKSAGNRLDRPGKSIAAFDFLYLPRLHRSGYIAPDKADVPSPSFSLPGGFVMDTEPGFYENVVLLDFKSLYPTCMITFSIDPLGYVQKKEPVITTPAGTHFSRSSALLPRLLQKLLDTRTAAKREQNIPLSTAIKILMNSFYGVLGTRHCRFFNPHIAATITRTGKYILTTCAEHITQQYHLPVIYGDTDSLFLCMGQGRDQDAAQTGKRIAAEVTQWLAVHCRQHFGVESVLELEFECHFRRFFVPGIRGGHKGSKKRYCGTVSDGKEERLVFKGLESARTDWTPAARDFQHELFSRIFNNENVEACVRETVRRIWSGEADEALVYRKRLHKPVREYGPSPPHHVQAAAQLDNPPPSIAYYITVEGPQPVQHHTARLDYRHYIDCQIKPVADAVLPFIGKDFDAIVSGQTNLFD